MSSLPFPILPAPTHPPEQQQCRGTQGHVQETSGAKQMCLHCSTALECKAEACSFSGSGGQSYQVDIASSSAHSHISILRLSCHSKLESLSVVSRNHVCRTTLVSLVSFAFVSAFFFLSSAQVSSNHSNKTPMKMPET